MRIFQWLLAILAFSGVFTLFSGHFVTGFAILAVYFFLWSAAGRPWPLELFPPRRPRTPKQKRVREPKAQPQTLAGVATPSIGGRYDQNIVGPVSRLDPQWRAWLASEVRRQDERER